MNTKEQLETRVALVAAWTVMVDTLGRLMHAGSLLARTCWEAMPDSAPVGSRSTLMRAIARANDAPVPIDCLPEWDAYLDALACFHALPLYGPAPVPVPDGAIAACDNGAEWHFRRG